MKTNEKQEKSIITVEEPQLKLKKLLPCGCEKDKCSCKLSNFEYLMKYGAAMGPDLAQTIRENKIKTLKFGKKEMQEMLKNNTTPKKIRPIKKTKDPTKRRYWPKWGSK